MATHRTNLKIRNTHFRLFPPHQGPHTVQIVRFFETPQTGYSPFLNLKCCFCTRSIELPFILNECLGTSLLLPLPQNLFGRTHSVCAYGQSRDSWYSARTYPWHRSYLNLYPYCLTSGSTWSSYRHSPDSVALCLARGVYSSMFSP